MDSKALLELWNPLSKAVSGKFHWSGGHSKHNCLQNWANFHRSRALQINLIVNIAFVKLPRYILLLASSITEYTEYNKIPFTGFSVRDMSDEKCSCTRFRWCRVRNGIQSIEFMSQFRYLNFIQQNTLLPVRYPLVPIRRNKYFECLNTSSLFDSHHTCVMDANWSSVIKVKHGNPL